MKISLPQKTPSRVGFTLVELMIVIAIIGILAAALFPSLTSYLARARDTQRVQDMSKMTGVAEMYFSDFGSYPIETLDTDTSCGAMSSIVVGNPSYTCENSVSSNRGQWYQSGPNKDFYAFKNYIQKLPVDPVNARDYFYIYEPLNANEELCVSAGCRFYMFIHLEAVQTSNVGSNFIRQGNGGWYQGSYGNPQR